MSEQLITLDEQIPPFMQVMETALRSGYNIKQSLEIVEKDLGGPVAADVRQVLDDLANDMSLDQAFDRWLERSPHRDLDMIFATIKVQREVGGNLANKINLLWQIMDKRKGIT